MNGINPEHVGDEKADELCQILIDDSCAMFGHEKEGMEHPSGEKLLHKYWYRQSTGHHETTGSSTKTEIKDQPESAIDMKSFDSMTTQIMESNKGPLAIKLENPQFAEFTESLKVASSALKALERLHAEGKNIGAQLQAKASMSQDASLKKAAEDVKSMMKQLDVYLEEFRSMLATAGCFNGGDDLGDWPKDLLQHISNAENHIDGNKAMIKRMKAKLT